MLIELPDCVILINSHVHRGASKVELNKIREVFNQVKKTRVTQEEVDDFDSKMELYEHHLKHENPKKYKVCDASVCYGLLCLIFSFRVP